MLKKTQVLTKWTFKCDSTGLSQNKAKCNIWVKDAEGRQHSKLDLDEILNWILTKLDPKNVVLSSQFIFVAVQIGFRMSGVKQKKNPPGTDIKTKISNLYLRRDKWWLVRIQMSCETNQAGDEGVTWTLGGVKRFLGLLLIFPIFVISLCRGQWPREAAGVPAWGPQAAAASPPGDAALPHGSPQEVGTNAASPSLVKSEPVLF